MQFLKKCENEYGACTDFINQQTIFTPLFLESFEHVLHLITVMILALFFFSRWQIYLVRLRTTWPLFMRVVGLTAVADMCTAFFYCMFKIYPVHLPLVVGFFITACVLLSIYFISGNRKNSFNLRTAIILGIVQGLALLPGISRLATTFVCACWLGFAPRKAFELSWLIAVPLFLAAGVQGLYKIAQLPGTFNIVYASLPYVLIAGIIAYFALKLTAYLFYTNRAWWFGVYIIVPITLTLAVWLV